MQSSEERVIREFNIIISLKFNYKQAKKNSIPYCYHSEITTINVFSHSYYFFLSVCVCICMCVSDIMNDYIVTI